MSTNSTQNWRMWCMCLVVSLLRVYGWGVMDSPARQTHHTKPLCFSLFMWRVMMQFFPMLLMMKKKSPYKEARESDHFKTPTTTTTTTPPPPPPTSPLTPPPAAPPSAAPASTETGGGTGGKVFWAALQASTLCKYWSELSSYPPSLPASSRMLSYISLVYYATTTNCSLLPTTPGSCIDPEHPLY